MEDYQAYELQCVLRHTQKGNRAWLFPDTPEPVLKNCGILHSYNQWRAFRRYLRGMDGPLQDTGIDFVAVEPDEKTIIGQSKCYREGSTLCQNHLAGFYRHMANVLSRDDVRDKVFGEVWTTVPPAKHMQEDHQNLLDLVARPRLVYNQEPLDRDFCDSLRLESAAPPENHELREYQREALAFLEEHTGGECALDMCPGSGKTLVFLEHIAAHPERAYAVLAPTRHLADQLVARARARLGQDQVLLVDTDGTRSPDDVVRHLGREGTVAVSTYASWGDVVLPAMQTGSRPATVVVDEAHLFSGDVPEGVSRMWVSGTMPEDLARDCDTHRFDLKQAIEAGVVCDYQVWIPSFTRTALAETQLEELPFTARSVALASAALELGTRSWIVYLNRVEDCRAFVEQTKAVAEWHGLEYEGWVISADVGQASRKAICEKFSRPMTPLGFRVIASVAVMNQGIDLPSCGGVFIAETPGRLTDRGRATAVQRMARANRKDPARPSKVAQCLLWAEEGDESGVAEFLCGLREYDGGFAQRTTCRPLRVTYGDSARRAPGEPAERSFDEMVRDISVRFLEMGDRFLEKLAWLRAFVAENERMPAQRDVCDRDGRLLPRGTKGGFRVGSWVNRRRTEYKNNTLLTDRIRALEAVPEWVWEVDTFNEGLAYLRAFVEKNKRMPAQKDVCDRDGRLLPRGTQGGFRVGSWVSHRRKEYKNNTLRADRIRALEAVPGWVWVVDTIDFDEGLACLRAFVEKNKRMPAQKDVCDRDGRLLPRGTKGGFPVGRWVDTRRAEYKKDKLLTDRIRALEAVPGWVWEVRVGRPPAPQ